MTDENSLDAGGWVARGDALSKQGRYEEALEELNRTAGRMGVGRAGCGAVIFGSAAVQMLLAGLIGGGLAWLVGTGLARALPGGSGVLSSAVAGAAIGTAIVLIERKRQKRY